MRGVSQLETSLKRDHSSRSGRVSLGLVFLIGAAGCGGFVAAPPLPPPPDALACSVPFLTDKLADATDALETALNGPGYGPGGKSCFECHETGRVDAAGEDWGLKDSTWAVAIGSLLARDAALGPRGNTVEVHISKPDTVHVLEGDALCGVRNFITAFYDEGGFACVRCDAADAAYDDFITAELDTLMANCATCHAGAVAAPSAFGGHSFYPRYATDADGSLLLDDEGLPYETEEARARRLASVGWGAVQNSPQGWYDALVALTTRSVVNATANQPAGTPIDFTRYSLFTHVTQDGDNPDLGAYAQHHDMPEWLERVDAFNRAFTVEVGTACAVAPPPGVDTTPFVGCEPPCVPYVPAPDFACTAYEPMAPAVRGGLWTPNIVDALTGPACAACHVDNNQGGLQYGTDAAALDVDLARVMSDPLGALILPQDTSLGKKVLAPLPGDTTHFAAAADAGFGCTEAGDAMAALIDGYANGQCAVGGEPEPDPGEPEPAVGCDEVASQQVWTAEDLGGLETFPASCSACHGGLPSEQGGIGTWGTLTGDWFDAARCSVALDGVTTATDTELYQAIAGTLPNAAHVGAPGKLAAMTAWISYRLTECSDFVCE